MNYDATPQQVTLQLQHEDDFKLVREAAEDRIIHLFYTHTDDSPQIHYTEDTFVRTPAFRALTAIEITLRTIGEGFFDIPHQTRVELLRELQDRYRTFEIKVKSGLEGSRPIVVTQKNVGHVSNERFTQSSVGSRRSLVPQLLDEYDTSCSLVVADKTKGAIITVTPNDPIQLQNSNAKEMTTKLFHATAREARKASTTARAVRRKQQREKFERVKRAYIAKLESAATGGLDRWFGDIASAYERMGHMPLHDIRTLAELPYFSLKATLDDIGVRYEVFDVWAVRLPDIEAVAANKQLHVFRDCIDGYIADIIQSRNSQT